MNRNPSLYCAIILVLMLFSLPAMTQEITLRTTMQTNSKTTELFTMKIKAPKGSTYYIDYGDGTDAKEKYGSGYAETVHYSFADMSTRKEHLVKVWGANFVEFWAISNRHVTELTVKDCPDLETLSCANNKIPQLDLSDCNKLTKVTCNNNEITSLKLPASVTSVDFSRNRLSLADFPKRRSGMNYRYAPMRPVHLSTSKINGLTVDLTEMLDFEGTKSTFKWYYFDNKGTHADPSLLIDPATYTERDGVFTFHQKPDRPIYCVVANSALPGLDNINDCYGIMPIELSGAERKLEQVHAAFVTDKYTTEGLTFDLQLSATKEDTPCLVDWGDGSFEEATLGVEPVTLRHNFVDAKVDRQHTVQIQCANLDLMRLPNTCGLIKFAPTTTPCPVKRLILDNNRVSELDLSAFEQCEEISANGCYMSQIKLPQSKLLKKLSLRSGTITEIDLSPYTALEELTLAFNKLSSLDLSAQTQIKKVDVSHNKLTSLTMPTSRDALKELDCSSNAIPMYLLPAKGAMSKYLYAPQEAFEITPEMIDGSTVDLSMFDNLIGEETTPQPTTYIWLHADDETLFIMEGVHYDVAGGKFTFKIKEPTRIFCTMETKAFPLLASKAKSYRSKPITVSAQGILSIDSSMAAETPLRMSVSGREVTLETAQSLVAQIFAMDGKIIWTKALSAGSAETLTLPQGAYILHAEGMDSVRLIIQ